MNSKSRETAQKAAETVQRCTATINQMKQFLKPLYAEKTAAMNILAVYRRRGIITEKEYKQAVQSGSISE